MEPKGAKSRSKIEVDFWRDEKSYSVWWVDGRGAPRILPDPDTEDI